MGLAALTSAASDYFFPSFYTAGACAFNTGLDLSKLANGGLGKVGIEELDKYPHAMPVYR